MTGEEHPLFSQLWCFPLLVTGIAPDGEHQVWGFCSLHGCCAPPASSLGLGLLLMELEPNPDDISSHTDDQP